MRTFIKSTFLTGCMAMACLCAFAQSNYLSAPWPYVYGTNPAGARTLANTAGVITSTTGVAVPIAAATGALTAGASGTSYVYWANSGNALSLTGTASTATTAPNVLVATVVAGSGSITSIAMVGNFTPLQFTNYRTPPVDLVAGITDTHGYQRPDLVLADQYPRSYRADRRVRADRDGARPIASQWDCGTRRARW